ncbi:MAG: hypothetical protein ACRCYS_12120 [Beijerinckiaceae bacterium]
MPAISATVFPSKGVTPVLETTLNGTDSFAYVDGKSRFLILRNPTGSAISPVIDGDGAATEYLPGVGDVSTATGFAVGSIPAAGVRVVDLRSIRGYLKGAISINSGTGLVAVLMSE